MIIYGNAVYTIFVQTVIETPAYLSAAKSAGMSDAERIEAIDMIARNPESGAVMPGTGGCRKLRLAGRGKGKSGGYRLITYFGGKAFPVFLLTVFSKGERANLSGAERNMLADMTATLVRGLSGGAS